LNSEVPIKEEKKLKEAQRKKGLPMRVKKTRTDYIGMEVTDVFFIKELPEQVRLTTPVRYKSIYFRLREDGAILYGYSAESNEISYDNSAVFKFNNPKIRNIKYYWNLRSKRTPAGKIVEISSRRFDSGVQEPIEWLTAFDIKMMRKFRTQTMLEKNWKGI